MDRKAAILVVDDVKSQKGNAKNMPAKLNDEADVVSSGKSAVEYLKRKRVDLVGLDLSSVIWECVIPRCETYSF